MARKPPIDIRELSKTGVLNEDRFFDALAAKSGYLTVDTTKQFYMSLVRLISSDLRENGIVRLPHIGDIALVKQKDRLGWAGRVRAMVRGVYVPKFFPADSFRKYFREYSRRNNNNVDPRERLLRKHI